jgi:hypothetical protein
MLLCQAARSWGSEPEPAARRSSVSRAGGQDGVGELAAQQPHRFGAGLAAGLGLGDVVAAGADAAGLVTAIMCRAQLMRRLPLRLRRTRPRVSPDQTGTGAVPLNRA